MTVATLAVIPTDITQTRNRTIRLHANDCAADLGVVISLTPYA
jgi:hypothetical protein